MKGTIIQGYVIESLLGHGGMGAVWRAVHQVTSSQVAIKFLLPKYSSDDKLVHRFFNEARAVERIQHPGTVKIHGAGVHDGSAYLIMELLHGETLAARIQRTGGLPISQISEFGRQITAALIATHRAGIVHRDLKPENIFVVPDTELGCGERVKLIDFGIAKLGNVAGLTSKELLGTAGYMAPEIWSGAVHAEASADVYALGCVLFEMCCGRRPFDVQSAYEACHKHVNERPPRARDLASWVPTDLDDLIAGALAKPPAERPTIAEMNRAFAAIAARYAAPWPALAPAGDELPPRRDREVAPASPAGPRAARAQSVVREPRGRWRRRLAVAASLVAVGVAAILGADRPQPPAAAPIEITIAGCPREMVPVPGGTLAMGSPDGVGQPDERPAHLVALSSYCIDRTEVTVAAYTRCVEDGACMPAPEPGHGDASLCNGTRSDRQDHPVNCVTWDQARSYCAFVNKRLPTEAEWEYAARGPNGNRYPWGNEPPAAHRLNACGRECDSLMRSLGYDGGVMYPDEDGWPATAPVKRYRQGVSPFGAFDMAGNVSEWTADWYSADYHYRATRLSEPHRTTRGGAWASDESNDVRGADRDRKIPTRGGPDLGFRCVR